MWSHPVRRITQDIVSILFIVYGVFALFTPVTPGSWLIIVGLSGLMGKARVRKGMQKILGAKLYERLRIDRFF
ncbi:MAG: hypothetical protein RI911_814 [Candidatus Parcubacteria bacterium]|jgi:hypothetical protein